MKDKIIKEIIKKNGDISNVSLELSLNLTDYFEDRKNEFDYYNNFDLEEVFGRFEFLIARISILDDSIKDKDILNGIDNLLNGFSIEENFEKLEISFKSNYSGTELRKIIKEQKNALLSYFEISPEEQIFLHPKLQTKKPKSIIYEILYFQSIKFLYQHNLTKNEFESILYRIIKAICDISFLYEKAYVNWADSFYNVSDDPIKRKNIQKLYEESAIKAGFSPEEISNLLATLNNPIFDEDFHR